ncbi:MAG TPA: hypothetical protein VMS64_35905 [Candidatus Methylomirabilis sp.]|nr:hypothetical protein [Candidatus Methylomirabilis sp.]
MDFGLFFLMQRDPNWEHAVYDSGLRSPPCASAWASACCRCTIRWIWPSSWPCWTS